MNAKNFENEKGLNTVNFLSSERCCFRCSEQGHVIRDCDAAQGCSVAGCTDPRHHTLLHKEKDNVGVGEELVCSAMEETTSKSSQRRSYVMTLPVRVRCGRYEALTYAILNSGSQRTF